MFTLIPPSTNLSFFYFKLFFLETVFLDLTPDISMPLELSYFENFRGLIIMSKKSEWIGFIKSLDWKHFELYGFLIIHWKFVAKFQLYPFKSQDTSLIYGPSAVANTK